MPEVRLDRDWTDATGTPHAAGATVEVDATTLAELAAAGVVRTRNKETGGRAGPTARPDDDA
ncbi:hypothetical protein Drose_29755 [Dactylosporangium roseum]|uniref:Uncharacterized protein n=1 Tax=Dactylosporangium roseum TaxID=47989 RepID=A0ABY5Z3G5_9ACTN|nr:hypothetical protein [Dactylosporangium roseum]UWZ35298.1 hypothetical protein Drose_29755 [Dactylosporangium roseum]